MIYRRNEAVKLISSMQLILVLQLISALLVEVLFIHYGNIFSHSVWNMKPVSDCSGSCLILYDFWWCYVLKIFAIFVVTSFSSSIDSYI